MPTYQYACTECDQQLEAVQSFSDPALTECPNCHGKLRKVFNSVGIVFKGSGFYRNDSRSSNGSTEKSNGSDSSTKKSDSSSSSTAAAATSASTASSSGSSSSGSSSSSSSSPSSSGAGKTATS